MKRLFRRVALGPEVVEPAPCAAGQAIGALEAHRLAAEQGKAGAQLELGIKYELGDHVPQDYAEAAKWDRLAAEQGVRLAQVELGWMYAYGHGRTAP